MAIAQGVSLGPYEIVARIGEGGMGEVWRARDQRIGRDVAVKILADSYTAGDQRVQRFEQEARAAGALNHPGLVTIFDVGTTEGSPYIVMELLEGQTLRDAIGDDNPRPIPLRKTIDYAIQIASALAVAHEKGIIHRDLKPENIFITSDNRVKILDFGLAKLAEDAPANGSDKHRPNRHLTSAGIVVGTPGYMSPEQVRAQPLDHRTDIFSLGSVLYEMLSGRPAFECFSAVETMHAVLNVEPPPLVSVDPKIPPPLDVIVGHCMEKNPRERFQSARDLAFQLRMLPDPTETTSGLRRPSSTPPALVSATQRAVQKRPTRAQLIAAVGLLAAAAGGFALYRAGRIARVTPDRTFRQLTATDGVELFPTLAADGKTFAYVSQQSGNRDIYVQRVDGRTAINITADSPDDDSEPAFSPEGGQIAFRSEREGGGIFIMGVTGESVRRLTDSDFGHTPSWSPDGTRLVVSTDVVELRPQFRPGDGRLWIVDTRNGTRRALFDANSEAGKRDAVQPRWSPHGKRIAYWSNTSGRREILTVDPNAAHPEKTVEVVIGGTSVYWNPVWSPEGDYLYFGSDRDGTQNLWRIAIDEESGKPSGAPEPVSLPGAVSGHYAFSQQGDLVFATVTRTYRLLAMPFDLANATIGAPRMLFGGSQELISAVPSPDGQSVAFVMGGMQQDLFVANIDGTRVRQLTNDAARDRSVAWAPDSKTLYFYSDRSGAYHIWRIQADGSGLAEVTSDAALKRVGASNLYGPKVAPDGRTLAVETNLRFDAFVHLDRPPAQRVETFPNLGSRGAPNWSPDGQRLVGARDDGIMMYTPRTKKLENVLPHGVSPAWLPDNRTILFFDKNRIGLFDVTTRQERTVSFPPMPGVHLDWTASVSRDGSTFFARQNLEQGDVWLVHFEKN